VKEQAKSIIDRAGGIAAAVAGAVAVVALVSSGCGSGGATSSTSAAASSSGGGDSSPAAATAASNLAPIHGNYAPEIDPSNFVRVIDNRYFPLEPGTTFRYRGVAEDGKTPQTDVETVTHRTKRVMGVEATVVRDTVSQNGEPVERTFDWYAQDKQGNVWYMGEDSREKQNGKFARAGDSWTGGVGGAEPGIIMPADPRPGQEYRQEYYPGHALDQARVLGSGGAVKVPADSYDQTLVTDESAPKLDPGVHEHKWYVAGVGDVKEQTIAGNHEEIVLVGVTH
jgi:hypothetical protein